MSDNNIKQLPEDELCKQDIEPPSERERLLDETFEIEDDIPLEISPAVVKTSSSDLANSLRVEYNEHSTRQSLDSTQNCSFSSTLDDKGYGDIINILDDVLSHLTDKRNTSSSAAPVKYNITEDVNKTMDFCAPLEKSSKSPLDDNASTDEKENVCDQTTTKNESDFDKKSSQQNISKEITDTVSEAHNETFSKEENVCTLKVEELTSIEALTMNATVVIDLSESVNVEETDIIPKALDETFSKEENASKTPKVEKVTSEEELRINTSVIDLSETVTDEETSGIVPETLNETFPNEEKMTLNVEVSSEKALKINTAIIVDLSNSVNEEATDIVFETLDETFPKEDVCKIVIVKDLTLEMALTLSPPMTNIAEEVKYHDESTISCDETKVLSSMESPAVQNDQSSLKEEINQVDQGSNESVNIVLIEKDILQATKTKNTTIRSDLEDSSREIIFSDALSSSTLENCQESVVSSSSVQPIDKVKEVETERNDDLMTAQPFKGRKSAVDIWRSKLADVEAYSPSRLSLAAAFDNLKINTTSEDSFLSCEETSLVNDILDNNEAIDTSFENLHADKADEKVKDRTVEDIENNVGTRIDDTVNDPEEIGVPLENLHATKTDENVEDSIVIKNYVITKIDDIINNGEEIDISLENLDATKTDENVEDPILVENVITTEKDHESKSESDICGKSETSLNSTLSEDVFELTPRKETVSEESINDGDMNDVSLKPNSGHLNIQGMSLIPRKSRRSSGIMISTMNFGITPSPVKQHLDYLDNKYNKLFTESPSAVEKRMPEYERYLALKLEINHLQQDIAKLTLQLKQKEGEVMQLIPQKIKFPPVKYKKEIKSTVQEGSKWAEEKASLQDEILELSEALDNKTKEQTELQEKIDIIEKELKIVNEEASVNLQKIKDISEELKTAKETIEKLEHCLNETNCVLMAASSKLHNAQESYTREKQKHESTGNALHQIIDKYEEARRVVLAMKANEIIYKETIAKLRSDNDDLHKNYECFKKTALQKIDEANKENERIRAESTNKNVLKKRNSRQH